MRTLLVGIDFLNESLAALKLAVIIAARANSKIVLVFVNVPDKGKPIFVTSPDKIKAEVENRFKALIQKYSDKLPAENFSYRFKEGLKVEDAINEVAEETSAALIVIGTKGKMGFKLFSHSLAFETIEKSLVPVMSVRDGARISNEFKIIVVPIDDTLETRQKIPFTVILAKLFQAEIHLLAIYHTSFQIVKENIERYTRQSAEYLEANNVNFIVKSIESADVVKESIKYANEINADLISIMTVQITATANIWKGSFAEQLIAQSPIPVITVPPKELIRTLSR